jgi:hypothetical protein
MIFCVFCDDTFTLSFRPARLASSSLFETLARKPDVIIIRDPFSSDAVSFSYIDESAAAWDGRKITFSLAGNDE